MLKKYLFSAVLFFCIALSFAQIPVGYYTPAEGKTGATLKTALYNIIKGHTARTYANLWTDFQTTDKRSNGTVWDMYSNCTFTFGSPYQDDGSAVSSECEKYNREHSFPKSWFGGDILPMYTDLFHLVPTDKKVNADRGNYPYGEVSSPTYTSGNGSKMGTCSYTGYTGYVFEPIDEYKGDFARSYFYMVTRYEDVISTWPGCDMIDGSTFPAFTLWAKSMLLKWSDNDPVSQKEIDRNNAVYTIQHNRNPYIDHPEYAQVVWGTGTTTVEEVLSPIVTIFPNPAKDAISVEVIGAKAEYLSIVNLIGNQIVNMPFNGDKRLIDISNLNPGVYFIIIIGDNFKNTTKIVVF